jgi:hypothetical protein
MIQNALLQNGQIVEEAPYQLKDFMDKVDYLLLGDIHCVQLLNKEQTARIRWKPNPAELWRDDRKGLPSLGNRRKEKAQS